MSDANGGHTPSRFAAKYKLLDHRLGKGNFAVVNRGVHKETKEVFAMKCFSRFNIKPEDETAIFVEVDALYKVRRRRCDSVWRAGSLAAFLRVMRVQSVSARPRFALSVMAKCGCRHLCGVCMGALACVEGLLFCVLTTSPFSLPRS